MNHADNSDAPLIQLENLGVTFLTPRGAFRAVRSASLEIARGEVLGLVGESGCGKSTVAFAMMNYLPGTAQVEGAVRFEGMDISEFSEAELRELRGNRIAMVYQDPITSLNPSMRVGPQIEEVLKQHLDMDSETAQRRVVELFGERWSRRSRTHRQTLSAPVERRHAAARGHSDGARLRSPSADYGRADYRLGCHHGSDHSRPDS